MGFSSIAAQQKEKAAETLKSFLVLGLIGSLGLHIGLLGFGIGNLFDKVPQLQDEPLELTLIDPPTRETEQPIEQAVEKSSDSPSRNESPSVGSTSSSIALAPFSPSVVSQKQPKSLTNIQKKEVVENFKTPTSTSKIIQTPKEIVRSKPAQVAKITTQSKIVTAPKPVITSASVVAASPKPVATQISPDWQQSNQKLRSLLANTRNTQQKPNNTDADSKLSSLRLRQPSSNNLLNQSGNTGVNGAVNNSKIGTGSTPITGLSNRTGNGAVNNSKIGTGSTPITGLSNRTGSSLTIGRGTNSSASGSKIGIGNNPNNNSNNSSRSGARIDTNSGSGSNVATGTQSFRPRNAQPESSGNSNARSGGLACRTCSKPKYPDKARRRGLEGKAEINVDVDGRGNVTNVRLANSSGHSELDKAAIEEARRWKFKAPNGGKRSVSAKVDFAIEGSERSRKVRERRKRRQAESRRTPIENARSQPVTETTAPTPTRRIRQRRNPASSPLPSQTATFSRRRIEITPRRSQETVPPRRRARASTRRSLQQAPLTNQRVLRQSLRRQRQTSSQTKLRQSLRQLKQSQPTDNPND